MKTVIERIESLERLRLDLMMEYQEIVRPYGFGYNIPEEISKKATDTADHADRISAKIKALKIRHKIPILDKKPEANAKRHYSYDELIKAIELQGKFPNLSKMIFEGAIEFLRYVDTENMGERMTAQEFWYWLKGRIHKILQYYVDSDLSPELLRKNVSLAIKEELMSHEIEKAYQYKFLNPMRNE